MAFSSVSRRLKRGLLALAACACGPVMAEDAPAPAPRPNIVWIVGEDLGPELGCYGDSFAVTPNLDRLASEGALYTKCFTHTAVCAPSRHGLITGQYPIKTGAMHMRSRLVQRPPMLTELLSKAGYFTLWPGKTDFNFEDPKDFANSREKWWESDTPPPEPFFAYCNFTETHESQVRNDGNKFTRNTRRLTEAQRHDPARAPLPPFYPDDPEVRREVANYYDLVTAVDYHVGDVLAWLKKHHLEKDTIVIFIGDHGRGMPRYKRWCYDTGTRVPLIVRWPGKIPPGETREGLVEFLDLPATAMALSGAGIPANFDGVSFLRPDGGATDTRKFVHAARDYMDEAYDRIRSVRDARWRYVKNFHPEIPYSLNNNYMERGATMRVWRQWAAEGKLNEAQAIHFQPSKPPEELYDSENDPFELNNLAADPAHQAKLEELRAECERWMKAADDKGALTLEQLIERKIIHPRAEK